MTSQPESRSVLQLLRPLRDIAAWALVGVPAVLLFVSVLDLIPFGDGDTFLTRTTGSFYEFVNLPTIFLPLAAVLLALLVEPRHPKAKLITIIALAEYAAAAFFGVIFGFLVGLVRIAGFSVQTALQELLARAAWLGLLAVAGYAMYGIWRGLFYVAKPKAPPGVYGQPQYGVPGTFPGQPGYGQPPQPGQPGHGQPPQPGQPGYGQPQPGQPAYGQPQPGQPSPGEPGYGQPGAFHPGQPTVPHPGQPYPGQPAQAQPGQPPSWNQQAPMYGQPPVGQQPPAWGQPAPSTYGTPPPTSGAPAPGAPTSGVPSSGVPSSGVPSSGVPSSGVPGPGFPTSGVPGSAAPGSYGPGSYAPGSFAAPSSGAPSYPPPPAPPGFAEPTQVVPRPEQSSAPPASQEDDRTQIVGNERPGFGPADQDPPRA
ncbi:hypothetical protein [Actinoplanes sp. NBRC 103695]|uniref:hypothetical protein n=1 Tax=Actinoplanes sp. NBRC 103695 TaxID=3032202 RepID=UPI0024A39250|nr:hypothetical protein [Actinoplanes sp. NBRC 103695]GLZ01102.1 hypothetical protein Acsp02_83530 [Actinoplanes sp. NBRC 103695]